VEAAKNLKTVAIIKKLAASVLSQDEREAGVNLYLGPSFNLSTRVIARVGMEIIPLA